MDGRVGKPCVEIAPGCFALIHEVEEDLRCQSPGGGRFGSFCRGAEKPFAADVPAAPDLLFFRCSIRPGRCPSPGFDVDAGGEGGLDHLPQRVEVVGGDPAVECKLFWGNYRLLVQDLDDVFQFSWWRMGGPKHVPGHFPPAEGDENADSGGNCAAQLFRDPVGEGRNERQRDGDLDYAASGRGHDGPFRFFEGDHAPQYQRRQGTTRKCRKCRGRSCVIALAMLN